MIHLANMALLRERFNDGVRTGLFYSCSTICNGDDHVDSRRPSLDGDHARPAAMHEQQGADAVNEDEVKPSQMAKPW